jgi:hypothetical protein
MTNRFEGIDNIEEIRKEGEQLENVYKAVFISSRSGIEVLADILINFCHYGCFLETPEQIAQYNVGIEILSRLGVIGPAKDKMNLVINLVNSIPKKED